MNAFIGYLLHHYDPVGPQGYQGCYMITNYKNAENDTFAVQGIACGSENINFIFFCE